MYFVSEQITFQELPSEICLSYMIAGCPLRCPGCHSSEFWSSSNTATNINACAKELTSEYLEVAIKKNTDFITCVLFLGGEWHQKNLIQLLKQVRSLGLKTALYTGLDTVDTDILENLDYLKTGPWIEKLGGLRSPLTNQKLIHVPTQSQIYLNTHN